MPVVPDYNSQAQLNAMPNIRVSPDAPLSALGGGQAAAELTQSQLQLGKSIEQEITKQKREADQMMVLGVESEMAPIETDLVHGPNGALSKRGKDALAQPEATADYYKKIAQEKIGKLHSEDARNLATQRLKDNHARVYSTVMSHAAKEGEILKDTTDSDYVTNETNAAIKSKDLQRIADAHDNILATLASYAKRKGMNDIEFKTLSDAAISKLNAGVTTSYLEADNYPAAKRYYDATFKDLLPADERNLSGAMKKGKVDHIVLTKSDEIFAKYPDKGTMMGDGTNAQMMIDKEKDPEVRKALDADLRYRYDQKAQQIKVAGEAIYLDALSKAQSNTGVPINQVLDVVTREHLTPAQLKSCEQALNPPVKPNDQAMLDFTAAFKDGTAARMNLAELNEKYLTKMNPAQQVKAKAYWDNARDAAANPAKAVKSISDRSFEEMVDSTMGSTNLLPQGFIRKDLDPAQVAEHQQFSDEAYNQIQLAKADHPERDLSQKEMKDIMTGIALNKFYTKGTIYGSNEQLAFQTTPDQYKKVSTDRLDKEFPGSVDRIKNYLSFKNQSATDENVGQLYIQMTKNPNLWKKVMEGNLQ